MCKFKDTFNNCEVSNQIRYGIYNAIPVRIVPVRQLINKIKYETQKRIETIDIIWMEGNSLGITTSEERDEINLK